MGVELDSNIIGYVPFMAFAPSTQNPVGEISAQVTNAVCVKFNPPESLGGVNEMSLNETELPVCSAKEFATSVNGSIPVSC